MMAHAEENRTAPRGIAFPTLLFHAILLVVICPIAFPSLWKKGSDYGSSSPWDIATGVN